MAVYTTTSVVDITRPAEDVYDFVTTPRNGEGTHPVTAYVSGAGRPADQAGPDLPRAHRRSLRARRPSRRSHLTWSGKAGNPRLSRGFLPERTTGFEPATLTLAR